MQSLIPPKRFDIFSPLTGGCSESLGAFGFFFKQHSLKKEKNSTKVGIEPPSMPLSGFQGSRGSRKIKKAINNKSFIVPLIYPDFERRKKTFSSKVGIEPPSTPLLGFQSSRGSRMTGLSESIGECCAAPLHVLAKEVETLAPPARIEYTT